MQEFDPINTLKGLKQHDQQAFKSVFNHFFSRLYYYADNIVTDNAEAEDIVLKTFEKFWIYHENFDSVPNIQAFLYITTRNACFNFLKAHRRNQEYMKEFTYLSQLNYEEETDELNRIHSSLVEKLYKELEQLPEKCREVFKYSLLGMSNVEIARKLGIPESTAGNHKAYAIKLLREKFTKKDLLLVFTILLLKDLFHPN